MKPKFTRQELYICSKPYIDWVEQCITKGGPWDCIEDVKVWTSGHKECERWEHRALYATVEGGKTGEKGKQDKNKKTSENVIQ